MTFREGLFPPCERVLYRHSPLTQVICQLRFPSILRIESQPPADFQDRIRRDFPIFERSAAFGGQQIPPEILRMMGAGDSVASYIFKTEDGNFSLTLGNSSISLTCQKYDRWEQFVGLLDLALTSFVEIYQPSFYNRIGLRYVNVIQRSTIGLEGHPWTELLREELLGEMRIPQWEERTFEARRSIRVRMSDGAGAIFLQHGLSPAEQGPELRYAIDFDFYQEAKVEVGNAAATLEKFHERSGRAFRWCITSPLHEALGPQKLDD